MSSDIYPAQFNLFVRCLFELEGGYVDNRFDPGGKTNYGITQNSLETYHLFEKNMSNFPNSVINISKNQAIAIYFKVYYVHISEYGHLNNEFRYNLFDIKINSGDRALKDCIYKTNQNNLNSVYEWRTNFYNSIVLEHENEKVFLKGWLNRLERIKEFWAKNS